MARPGIQLLVANPFDDDIVEIEDRNDQPSDRRADRRRAAESAGVEGRVGHRECRPGLRRLPRAPRSVLT
jgi:hypothetical protein